MSLGKRAAVAFAKEAAPGFIKAIGAAFKRPPVSAAQITGAANKVSPVKPQLPATSGWRDYVPTPKEIATVAAATPLAAAAPYTAATAYDYTRRLSPNSPELPNWIAPVVSKSMPPSSYNVTQPAALPDLMKALPQDARESSMQLWHGEPVPGELEGNVLGPARPASLITETAVTGGFRPKLDQAAVQLLHRRNAHGAPLRFGTTRNGAHASTHSASPGITVSPGLLSSTPTSTAAGIMNHELEHVRQKGMERVTDTANSLSVPHEFAAGVGDMVFRDEAYRIAMGQSPEARLKSQTYYPRPDLGGGYRPEPRLAGPARERARLLRRRLDDGFTRNTSWSTMGQATFP